MKNWYRCGVFKFCALVLIVFFTSNFISELYLGTSELYLGSDVSLLFNCNNLLLIKAMLVIVSMLYLVIVAGRSSKDEKIHIYFFDKIYAEISIVIMASIINFTYMYIDYIFKFNEYAVYGILGGVTLTIVILTLGMVKQMRNKSFVRCTLIGASLYGIVALYKKILFGSDIRCNIAAISFSLAIIALVPVVGVIIASIIAVSLVAEVLKEVDALKTGIARIKSGDLSYKIEVSSKGELADIASDINNLVLDIKNKINAKIKSERLRTDTIVGMARNLNEPLDSINEYISILSSDGISEKDSKKYLDLLSRKSLRLKALASDFTDLEEGNDNLDVKFEKIDVFSLITNELIEVEERFKKDGITIKLNLHKQKMFVYGDRNYISRIIDILFSNILAHSKEKGRVLIEAADVNNEIMIGFTNEGSDSLEVKFGSGLRAARNLAKVQGGDIEVKKDGANFIAIVKLQKFC